MPLDEERGTKGTVSSSAASDGSRKGYTLLLPDDRFRLGFAEIFHLSSLLAGNMMFMIPIHQYSIHGSGEKFSI